MARIYEVPPETRPGRRLALSYFHGADRARLEQAVERALRDGEPYDLELQLTTPGGRQKWVRAQGRRVLEDGRPVRLEGITQDITERRAAQEALQALNAELERRVAERTAELQAANAELDSFAYAVSHDLRAPLRAMSGFAQALVEDHGDQLDAAARADLDEIVRGSARMGELIDGLLVLSRSLRGTLRADDVDLSALALQCAQELQRDDPQRQVTVVVAPGLRASGDRRMLDAVLRNLIGNAWKYSARTSAARIEVGSAQIDGETWFVVKDNGAGFDMAHAGRLFKAFARLHRQDEFPGLGIGLATVQRIIRRHGGRIVAEAAPGQGATFRFTLPAQRSDPLRETGST
jgi:light-regulated signal transduction histidine kinase (bacteriophytochrome)